MSAEEIPVEILVMIFNNLEAKDAVTCRAVCRRWRDVADSLSDEVWERYCYRDFWNPKAANKVSNLGFRELYKSLALWTKVEKAEVTCKQLSTKHVSHFKILNNNTLVVLINNSRSTSWGFHRFYNNQVEYYNMKDMKLISCECYEFYFKKYDENDKLIALVDMNGALCVITKSNKKRFFVGKMSAENNFTLFDTKVYYVDIKEILCVARLKVVDGEETVENEQLEDFFEHVIAFANATESSVNMLTDEGNIYCYQHNDKDFESCSQIDSWTPNIIYELWDYGFHWSDPKIYKWLELFDEEQVKITKLKSAVIHSHNHVILIGTSRGTLHIFKRPYKKNGELVLYKARPNKSIDMNEYSGTDKASVSKEIKQLGIVEIQNGHRIVVLTKNIVFCVDLYNKEFKTNKKSPTNQTPAELSTSTKKAAKVVKRPAQSRIVNNKNNVTKKNAPKKIKTGKKSRKTTDMTVKYVYNTRSKDKCSRIKK